MTIETITERSDLHSGRTSRKTTEMLLGQLRSLGGWILRCAERRRGRLALLELTDDQLKDIGLSRADAWNEGNRSIWDR